jgi:hypothetical protein
MNNSIIGLDTNHSTGRKVIPLNITTFAANNTKEHQWAAPTPPPYPHKNAEKPSANYQMSRRSPRQPPPPHLKIVVVQPDPRRQHQNHINTKTKFTIETG